MTDSTNKTCDYFSVLIDAFHDGELDASESREVSLHIDACQVCRLRLSQVEQVVSVLRLLPRVGPEKDFAEDLDQFVIKPVSMKAKFTRSAILSSLSIAAAFVFLLMASSFILHRWQDPLFPSADGPSVSIRAQNSQSILQTKIANLSKTAKTIETGQPKTTIGLSGSHAGAPRLAGSSTMGSDLASQELLAFYAADQTMVSEELGIMTNEDGLYALKRQARADLR